MPHDTASGNNARRRRASAQLVHLPRTGAQGTADSKRLLLIP